MSLSAVFVAVLSALLVAVSAPAAIAAGDDYPWKTSNPETMSPLRFNYRNCTDFVAWRLNVQLGRTSAPWQFTWSSLAFPNGNGNAVGWKQGAINSGYAVDGMPKIGSVAWWGAERANGLGHVAIVSSVNADGSVNIEQYNAGFDNKYSTQSNVRADAYLHIADISTPTGPGSPPSQPGAVTTLTHGSRVNVKWGAADGASDYLVFRDGRQIAATTATSFLDITVSPRQGYTYTVIARNGAGSSAPVTQYVRTTVEAADLAHLATKDGPAACGRAGDQSWQSLVCTVLKPSGWVSVYAPQGDWGYATDRAWLTNADGSASYCRRVNYGDQMRCDRFDGTNWTASTSPRSDLGYTDSITYLSTKDGPAVCGRAGDQSRQLLVCGVLKPSGWLSVYSPPGDWGYATDRAWFTNTNGTVSYCRRVNYGDQETCDRFDGMTWTASTSPRTDLGYPDTFP